MRECLLHKVSSCLGGEVNKCDFNTNRDNHNNITDSHMTPFVDNLYIFIYKFTIIYVMSLSLPKLNINVSENTENKVGLGEGKSTFGMGVILSIKSTHQLTCI